MPSLNLKDPHDTPTPPSTPPYSPSPRRSSFAFSPLTRSFSPSSSYCPERQVRTNARDQRLEAFLSPSRTTATENLPRPISPEIFSDSEEPLPSKSMDSTSAESDYLQASDTIKATTEAQDSMLVFSSKASSFFTYDNVVMQIN